MNPVKPEEIEAESFRIITQELEEMGCTLPEKTAPIIKRVIHTTADFSYVDTLCFSETAWETAQNLLQQKPHIITDTNMAKSGINSTALNQLGATLHCFIADPDVAEQAKKREITRAMVAVEKALEFSPLIYVVGNAPTALMALYQQVKEGGKVPDLIIGVPVGFVNVVESKELIMSTKIPYIIAKGRQGGSNIAAAIVNGLMYQQTKR